MPVFLLMWTMFPSICTYKIKKWGVIGAEPCFILWLGSLQVH